MNDCNIVVVRNSETPENFYEAALAAFPRRHNFASAVDALQYMEQEPAHVLITEYDLSEMTGVDLADTLRDIDTDRGQFTYIIIISNEAQIEQISAGRVDAAAPGDNPDMIAATLATGVRLSSRLNRLMADNRELEARCAALEKGQLLDPLTGLGNRRMAEQVLDDSIRQVESRGGAVCFMSIAIHNYDEVATRYDQGIADDLVISVSETIQHLVRPLDVVTRFDRGEFALILVQPTIEQCTAECYQRIYDKVKLKSYRTRAGFMDAHIAMSICAATAETGAPNPQAIIASARENLSDAAARDRILVEHLGKL